MLYSLAGQPSLILGCSSSQTSLARIPIWGLFSTGYMCTVIDCSVLLQHSPVQFSEVQEGGEFSGDASPGEFCTVAVQSTVRTASRHSSLYCVLYSTGCCTDTALGALQDLHALPGQKYHLFLIPVVNCTLYAAHCTPKVYNELLF